MEKKTFTGLTRRRQTRTSVKVMDRVARFFITLGGIGTIASVVLICAFLVGVTLPLFESAKVNVAATYPAPELGAGFRPAYIDLDEYQVMCWTLLENGEILVYRLDDGTLLTRRQVFPDLTPTAVAVLGSGEVAFGFDNGTIRIGRIGFTTSFLEKEDMPPEFRDAPAGKHIAYEGGIAELTPEGQFRIQKVRTEETEDPTQVEPPSPIRDIDLTVKPNKSPVFAALTEDGRVVFREIHTRDDMMTGETVKEFIGGEVNLVEPIRGAPGWLLLSGLGNYAYAVWPDGHLVRVNAIRNIEAPFVAEKIHTLGEGETVTALAFMNGKTTIVVGDSTGRVRAWFPVNYDDTEDSETGDRSYLAMAHEITGGSSPVTSLGISGRTRFLAIGHEDGSIEVAHVTNNEVVARVPPEEGAKQVMGVVIAPKDDGVLAMTPDSILRYDFSGEHADITFAALFRPIWYEGYNAPEHVWQSTGGTDEEEPKLGLWPLVFGTLKGTLYSMLFGLPIALLAAIFTSEFLSPKARGRIKPVIEIMASLPSVVLGFLAALVIAPFVESVVPACLAAFLTVPLSFVVGALLWQLLPQDLTVRHARWRFPLMCACLPVGILLAAVVGPLVERTIFAGDFMLWANNQHGGAFGAWLFMLVPASVIVAAVVVYRGFSTVFRRLTQGRTRRSCAILDIGRLVATGFLALLIAVAFASLLDRGGFDPRGGIIDTYIQRNAMIVGFVMGFAIIPIIYTISEDALSSVPDHLRSASLGAGATQWQTATRIVVPTAMSGLFSAAMIGLGRAVGETMIVLMAAGNTPITDLNIWNGFRSLSANIAVEIPEAPHGGTHYRVLFLTALVLFGMTFILNTAAEAVRLRFRKKAFEL